MWEITEDIEYKKEVEEIIKSMEDRVWELCRKIESGNYNSASLPAFWLGVQGDIDDGLKNARVEDFCESCGFSERVCMSGNCKKFGQETKLRLVRGGEIYVNLKEVKKFLEEITEPLTSFTKKLTKKKYYKFIWRKANESFGL